MRWPAAPAPATIAAVSQMVSRWPVLISPSVGRDDVDADGRLTVAGADRLAAEVRGVYLQRCRTLDGITLEVQRSAVVIGSATVEGRVTVSAAVTELFPNSFIVSTRIRPAEGPDVAAEVRTSIAAAAPLGADVRDELIALAHGAGHYH